LACASAWLIVSSSDRKTEQDHTSALAGGARAPPPSRSEVGRSHRRPAHSKNWIFEAAGPDSRAALYGQPGTRGKSYRHCPGDVQGVAQSPGASATSATEGGNVCAGLLTAAGDRLSRCVQGDAAPLGRGAAVRGSASSRATSVGSRPGGRRKYGTVGAAIVAVLAQADREMRVKDIHEEVERHLGGSVSRFSVSDYLRRRSKAPMPPVVRTRHGHQSGRRESGSPAACGIGIAHEKARSAEMPTCTRIQAWRCHCGAVPGSPSSAIRTR
jgi:hypothetical protein